MKLLGHEYSERVDRIYKSLSPPPKVRPFPSAWLTTGQSPQFAGMHVYHPTHGDIVFLVPEKAHEYTVAHELMHAVLRREGYPHFLSRPLRLEHNLVKLIVDSLEGAIVHPYLNQRLSNFEIAVEATYAQELLNGLKASDALEKYKAYVA